MHLHVIYGHIYILYHYIFCTHTLCYAAMPQKPDSQRFPKLRQCHARTGICHPPLEHQEKCSRFTQQTTHRFGDGSKLKQEECAGFSLWFHLPRCHAGAFI